MAETREQALLRIETALKEIKSQKAVAKANIAIHQKHLLHLKNTSDKLLVEQYSLDISENKAHRILEFYQDRLIVHTQESGANAYAWPNYWTLVVTFPSKSRLFPRVQGNTFYAKARDDIAPTEEEMTALQKLSIFIALEHHK